MNTELIADREKLQNIAAWVLTGLVALSGFRYVMRIISWLFFELYRMLVLGGKLIDKPI